MQPGQIIADKYELQREIGKGGMGSVWAAVHKGLGRTVAVKFLRPQADHDATATDRFVSEARMVAAIKHRFVVDVFDFGVTSDGLYYMVLELLEGESLAERITEGPPFAVRDAVELITDCLRGLHAVHEAGVVHRDLKPENIFVIRDADGAFPKLIDFGISKKTEDTGALDSPGAPGDAAGRSTQLTRPGMIVGTPYYMSPEQLRGRADLDRRADIFSMGVILYELIAGRLPFDQDNIGDLMVAITSRRAPTLSVLRPELGKELSDVVARALDPERDARPPTALALRDALLAVLPSLPERELTGTHQLPTPGAYGKATELLMQAADDPFAGERRKQAGASAAGGKRLPMYIAAAVLVAGLLAWLLGTRGSQPASEAPAASPGMQPPSAAIGAPSPATVAARQPVAPAAEPAAPAPAPAAPAQIVAPSEIAPVRESAAAHAPAAAKSSHAAPAAGESSRHERSSQKPAAAPKKIYQKLDF